MSVTTVHDPRSPIRSTHLTVRLPDRFDVHQLPSFEAEMLETFTDVELDLGDVRFLDQHALRALVKARADAILSGHEVWIGRISTAAQVTLELTGLTEAVPLEPAGLEVA